MTKMMTLQRSESFTAALEVVSGDPMSVATMRAAFRRVGGATVSGAAIPLDVVFVAAALASPARWLFSFPDTSALEVGSYQFDARFTVGGGEIITDSVLIRIVEAATSVDLAAPVPADAPYVNASPTPALQMLVLQWRLQIAGATAVSAAIVGPPGRGNDVTSVNGQTGVVVLGKATVGLWNVDNTSDTAKPVSTAQAAAIATSSGVLSRLLLSARALRIGGTGDSILAGPSGTILNGGGHFQYGNSWFNTAVTRANAINGGRFQLVVNAGVGGNTSAMARARFVADVLSKGCDVVVIQLGTNNDTSSAGVMSNAGIAALFIDLEWMVQQTLALGALPVIVVPPVMQVSGRALIRAAAAGFRNVVPFYYMLANAYGVPLIDLYKVTADPLTGNWRAGLTEDTEDHPTETALDAIASYAAPILADLGNYRPLPYTATVANTASAFSNLLINGNFAIQSAGVPTNWTFNAGQHTLDASADAALPYRGKVAAFTKPTGTSQTFAAISAIMTAIGGGAIPIGNRLRVTGMLSVSGFTVGNNAYEMQLQQSSKLTGMLWFVGYQFNGDHIIPALETVVNSELTAPTVRLAPRGTGTYALRGLTVLNMTALEAVWSPSQGRW